MTEYEPVFIALALVAVVVISARLSRMAQPLRLKAAELGEQLLADNRLPDTARSVVEVELSHAFSQFWYLVVGLFLVPVFAVWVVFNFENEEHKFRIPDDELRGRFDEFTELTDRIASMNHPVLYPLLKLAILLAFAVTLPIAALFGKTISEIKPAYLFATTAMGRI